MYKVLGVHWGAGPAPWIMTVGSGVRFAKETTYLAGSKGWIEVHQLADEWGEGREFQAENKSIVCKGKQV